MWGAIVTATSDGHQKHRVVIIGSGFGGLFAAQALRREPVEVTVVAKTTHHLFQPLLYQVATGILSEGEIAPATREVLRRQQNVRTVLGEVVGIDLAAKTVTSNLLGRTDVQPYDSLIVAAGAGQSYFGNDHFAEHAPGMKSIDDALELRGRIFGAFEVAETSPDPADAARYMTFVVVGAGPTGVEMAGQIAEMAHRTLRHDFRKVDTTKARIILLDAAPTVLGTFGEKLAGKATAKLEKIGVEIQLGARVVNVDSRGIDVEDSDGTRRRIESVCKIWAAGVAASPLGKQLAEQSGAVLDRAGRIQVQPDLTLPGHPEVFVVGDMATLDRLPGVAQVAIQGGKYASKTIATRLRGGPPMRNFEYKDKGSMATISRFSAVASIKGVQLSGFLAWLMWLAVHLVYIIGFKHRVTTLLHWTVSFVGRGRSERTVTQQQIFARSALQRLGEGFMPTLPDDWASRGPSAVTRPAAQPGAVPTARKAGADAPRLTPDGTPSGGAASGSTSTGTA
ncbi:NAD(P)/FAD-dependent oxidoreductase [Parafrankia elaeagni]|uniref:NAD(P)/FAD-dependent oxidoreductase n=1 Tax=Parafrankia elaeagni TaxID=222534 RepID=UPI0005577476